MYVSYCYCPPCTFLLCWIRSLSVREHVPVTWVRKHGPLTWVRKHVPVTWVWEHVPVTWVRQHVPVTWDRKHVMTVGNIIFHGTWNFFHLALASEASSFGPPRRELGREASSFGPPRRELGREAPRASYGRGPGRSPQKILRFLHFIYPSKSTFGNREQFSNHFLTT